MKAPPPNHPKLRPNHTLITLNLLSRFGIDQFLITLTLLIIVDYERNPAAEPGINFLRLLSNPLKKTLEIKR